MLRAAIDGAIFIRKPRDHKSSTSTVVDGTLSFLHCDNHLTLVDDVIEKPIAGPAILLLRRRWPR